MRTKGEMGVGTLIIFIALLLVAAVAAGVLITTAGTLQEKALSTGKQATGKIATHIDVIEISATNGTNGTLLIFKPLVSLSAGSNPIDLSDITIVIGTSSATATITYAGIDADIENNKSGYYTLYERTWEYNGTTWPNFITMGRDYNFDGLNDWIAGGLEGTLFTWNYSTGGSGGTAAGQCAAGTYFPLISFPDSYILSITGVCSSDNNVTSFTIVPQNASTGKFVAEHLQKGSNYAQGQLKKGDVLQLYIEAPEEIGPDEYVRINFIQKIGTPTLIELATPNVIASYQEFLYP